MKALVACLVIGLVVVAGLPSARAVSVRERVVLFGVPRRPLVPGVLDFEAGCRVTASYAEVAVADGSSAVAPLTVAPGGCDVAVYVFGARVGVPLPFQTPLGRTSYRIPGVSGITLGLADVSVDLSARLRGRFSGDGVLVSASPDAIEWSAWGTGSTTIAAHSGSRGSTLVTTAPWTLSLAFGVGVSVYVLGVRVFSWETTVAVLEGTPRVEIPVIVDLAPSPSELTSACAESPSALRVAWSESPDDDFAAYEVSVSEGGASRTLVFRDRSVTSSTIDAAPSTSYEVQVTVVDRAGQRAASASWTVTMPDAPQDHRGFVLTPIAVLLLAAVAGAVGADRTRRRARMRRAEEAEDVSGASFSRIGVRTEREGTDAGEFDYPFP